MADVTQTNGLSRRETEILRLAATGHCNPDIARELGITSKTVENHLTSVFDKLGVHNRTQATLKAIVMGLVGLGGVEP